MKRKNSFWIQLLHTWSMCYKNINTKEAACWLWTELCKKRFCGEENKHEMWERNIFAFKLHQLSSISYLLLAFPCFFPTSFLSIYYHKSVHNINITTSYSLIDWHIDDISEYVSLTTFDQLYFVRLYKVWSMLPNGSVCRAILE